MDKLERIVDRLASVKLTLVCLGLTMVLVVVGTLAQVHMGTFAAQKVYFNSFWIYQHGLLPFKFPILPGGLTVGVIWMVNLLAAFAARFKYTKRDLGILITHFGLIFLLLGQFLTQMLAQESQLPIEIGQTKNYSESPRENELAIVDKTDAEHDQVTSIPAPLLARKETIRASGLPFTIHVHKFFPNSRITMTPQLTSPATQGVGASMGVQEIPPVTTDDEINIVSAYIEIKEGDKSLGTWLVSSDLGAPQSFSIGGRTFEIYLRPRRHYLPFTLTLKEFHHDLYPGTEIPKNFSSLVHINDPAAQESRDTLIYMNHPLRYRGKTYYQASFGKNNTLSVFQVVENPAWLTPYISCTLVILGLAIQFLMHLFAFAKRRA